MPPLGSLARLPLVATGSSGSTGAAGVPATSVGLAGAAVASTESTGSAVAVGASSRSMGSAGVAGPSSLGTGMPLIAHTSAGGASARLMNLLPHAISVPSSTTAATGVYVVEGLPPVPLRLSEKISQWEYVEMAEMLPEF